MSPFDDALVLTGPTGCGKSAWALALAPELNAEIISMDSMTLYRGMDIGTAKPTREERQQVPHHLIDILDPWESANVAWWLDHAKAACEAIRSRGKRPLFVGGTPFYLMALRYGLFDAPPADESIRKKIEEQIQSEGAEAVHTRLRAVDPIAGNRIHAHDTRRLVRALEVFELTGRPLSSFQQSWDTPGFTTDVNRKATEIRIVRLEWPRELLYERIDRRVETMVEAGWIEECRILLNRPQALSREAAAAIGYREWFAFLNGTTETQEQTIARIQQKTRQFAKRQMTWFRRMKDCPVLLGDATDVGNQILQHGLLPKSLFSRVEFQPGP